MPYSPDISIIFPVTDKVDRDHFPEKLAALWKMIQNWELAQMLPIICFRSFTSPMRKLKSCEKIIEKPWNGFRNPDF